MKYNSDILRALHQELYDVLGEVVRVCEAADIPYFIQGGTAIGAHFFEDIVPWDDDIDLGMTRENYERFLREAPALLGEGYVLQEFTTERDTPFYYIKIRKCNTSFVESEWVGLPISEGIYVDIFPYDIIPDDERLRRSQRRKVGFLVNCFMAKSVWLWRWLGKANNGVVFPKSWLSCAAIKLYSLLHSKGQIYNKLKREMTRYNDSDGAYYNIVRMPKDMIARRAIENLEPRKFGEMTVMAPSNLETYLRSHYGDIQKWLPEPLRLNHAPEVLSFVRRITSTESESISVVIPLYNKELEVERALRSVLSQSLMPGEIIVVDDGSTDGSRAIVERVMSENIGVNIRLIVQENAGVSAARNRGIQEAKGDYVALLDADDFWLSGYIAEVCRMMAYYPNMEAYATAFDIVSGGSRVRAAVPENEGVVNPAEEALKSRYPIIPSTSTLLRSGEDQWLWVRMMQRGCRFAFSPMSLVRYSREASNRSAAIYRSEQSARSLEELYSPTQDATMNEYVARIALGKAITQSVRGGTEDARRAEKYFSYTQLSRRQLHRLRVLNMLPVALRSAVDRLYASLAWLVKRRGL